MKNFINTPKILGELYGDKFLSSTDLFTRSLCVKAETPFNNCKPCLWVIINGHEVGGQDLVRAHYEHYLKVIELETGQPQKIDPYNGPRHLVFRLKQMGWHIEMTLFKGNPNRSQIEHEARQIEAKRMDIQAICFNLDAFVYVPKEESTEHDA
jgi:hypothetical protein